MDNLLTLSIPLFVHEHLRRRDPNGVALESLNKRNHPPTSLVDGWFYLRDWSFYSSDISNVST